MNIESEEFTPEFREALASLEAKGFIEIFYDNNVQMVRLTELGAAQAELIMQLMTSTDPKTVIN